MSAGRPETHGFRKPLSNPKPESVTLASIRMDGGEVHCSCGWAKAHVRKKVLEAAADTHASRKHGGRAIWL